MKNKFSLVCIKIMLTFFIGALIFSSCSDEEIAVNNEERIISTFYYNAISDTTGTLNVIDSAIVDGVIKLTLAAGDNNKIERGDSVHFYYIGAILNSTGVKNFLNPSNVFMTNIDSIATQCKLDGMVGIGEERGIAGKNHYIKGLDIGLTMMNEYENALVFFPSQLAYGNNSVGAVPAGSPLIFQIIITKIKKN
jgi:hypothetical protein